MNWHLRTVYEVPNHGKQTKAIWNTGKASNCIVFVHGFRGSPLLTWSQFPLEVRSNEKFRSSDIFFFGYESTSNDVFTSSTQLRAFLSALHTPDSVLDSSQAPKPPNRSTPAGYETLTLVAHSLGSIVCRRAMIDGYETKEPAWWAPKTRLINFAPAHNGAKIENLLAEAFGILGPIAAIAQLFNKYISLADLKIGCRTLSDLRDHTIASVEQGRKNLIALDNVFAQNDKIVSNQRFANDFASDDNKVIKGKTHSTVCKPDNTFMLPVQIVSNQL